MSGHTGKQASTRDFSKHNNNKSNDIVADKKDDYNKIMNGIYIITMTTQKHG